MKILITGNPNYGIAKSMKDVLHNHELTFVSRATGMDLNNSTNFNKLIDMSLEYDIFINNSRVTNFFQSRIFEQIYNIWLTNKKSGLIINVGSGADSVKEKVWIYGPEKAALRKITEQSSFATVFKKTNIKTTYISFGYVNTPIIAAQSPNVNKHDPEEVANLIKWIIDYPAPGTNINEIRIEPIQ